MSEGAGYRDTQGHVVCPGLLCGGLWFDNHGSKWPRCVRMADDYSQEGAPQGIRHPFLDVGMLRYLEKVILDTEKPMVYRITSGKLRLCAQASIRHDDLNNTPLRNTEWCRLRGGVEQLLGLGLKPQKPKQVPDLGWPLIWPPIGIMMSGFPAW